jgi:CBS-domain-containing membrane protein
MEKLAAPVRVDPLGGPQRSIPVVDAAGRLAGVVTRFDLHQLAERAATDPAARLDAILRTRAGRGLSRRAAARRRAAMADTGLTHFPVVERGPERRLLGIVSLEDLLQGHARNLEASAAVNG